MSDVSSADAGTAGAEQSPVTVVPGTPGEGRISVREAASTLSRWRLQKPQEQSQAPVEQAPEAAPVDAAQESAPDADAAPPQEVPGETREAEPAEVPPIEPPRSWTKEEKERFTSLPRETQEYLAHREQDRERAVRQSQNEAAEQRKAVEAERQQVEQVRQHYEQALPALLETLQQQQAGEFSDIKTMADVERLAREDWPRYVLWDAQQKKLAAIQQQVQAAQERQTTEKQTKLRDFIKEQGDRFLEKAPEFADQATASKVREAAVTLLKDIGFANAELESLYRGEKEISLHDHRLQLLIRDGVKYREMQDKAKTVAAKPLPPAQRPGTAQPRGAAQAAELQALTNKLDRTGNLKDAAALLRAQRRSRAS